MDKASRSRCTYCRWQKCLSSGMNQASVQEILSLPTNSPQNTFFSFYPQFLIFQEGEKRSLAQSLPPTHSPITSNLSSGQIPEHDHLDTLSNEVVQTSSLSILSLFNDKVLGAEVYSSQFLEKEEVGHLYYIFAWAQRVFKVATLQEDFIVTMQFLSQRSSWYWSKINHFDRFPFRRRTRSYCFRGAGTTSSLLDWPTGNTRDDNKKQY